MPTFSTITLTDRLAANHTFLPRMEEDNGVYRFTKAGANGVVIGSSHLRVSIREASQNVRVRLKIDIPSVQTETVNGVDSPKVVHTNMVDVVFTFAKTSTTAERELIIGLMADALASDQPVLDAVLKDLESIF